MEPYKYRPVRFYVLAFSTTWAFWLEAILFNEGLSCTLGMLLGLLSPAAVIVLVNRDMFFETRHIGKLPEEGAASAFTG